MAIDLKYGKVTVENEPGNPLGEDEPVVVFRARDTHLSQLLWDYWVICSHGKSPQEHLDKIHGALANVKRWQDEHPNLVKIPD